MILILPFLGLFTLAGLLNATRREDQRGKWLFKPLTSALFVLTGLLGLGAEDYQLIVALGLVLGMLGDVLLIPMEKPRWFLAGLVAFLLGHIAYVVAFAGLLDFSEVNFFIALPLLFLGSLIYSLLYSKWGSMKLPVLAYFTVISLMVFMAIAVNLHSDYSANFRSLVMLGAIAFYFSDLGVAIDRFVGTKFKNALWSLPLYYAAQFMIALSLHQL